ncbi:MAG: UDP-N-acetylmuramate--L-alanine ligase [Actinomycetota bacterium]|nr:UDP-N-acetylmuramate--L-alanine ligase [Actinomycetota bacterium]
MTLEAAGRVHFVGIGGAGMSAIAKILVERGGQVSGSDLKESPATSALRTLGASVAIGHDGAHVKGASTVVVSSAIATTNPEVERARRDGIPVMTRGEALAALVADKRAIVVAGTHGKTTTTSMIVSILQTAGLDPTYLVGGGLNDSGTNAASGSSDIAVVESDESDASFLLLRPHIAVVTNVELDHVDHWRDIDELRAAFRTFLGQTDRTGAIVLPADDALAAEQLPARVVAFGTGGRIAARDEDFKPTGTAFTLVRHDEGVSCELKVPGAHNVGNALAAAAAGDALGISLRDIATGLARFSGEERRFDLRGTARDVTVVDDYAHHPTEIAATLATARRGEWARVVAVFQPHRYSRTASMWRAFGAAFDDADRVVITDVYGAGEAPMPGVTGKLVADAVAERARGRAVAYLPHRDDLSRYVATSARAGDVVLTLGAGDITTLGPQLLAMIDADGR